VIFLQRIYFEHQKFNKMKNLPALLLGLLFVATLALFVQSSPPVSDDEPSEQQTYWYCNVPATTYAPEIETPLGFVSKFRERVVKEVSLNIRLSNYQACVLKWNHTNRCKVQI
jgi:hypothetical protein